jgi:hypothetical protein
MARVPFTDREMQRAWEDNLKASQVVPRSNTHRLLLFYAIECGLKAVLMKRNAANCTNHCTEIGKAQHNLNRLLDALKAGKALKLPSQLKMSNINADKKRKLNSVDQERILDPGQINQAWRYGGKIIAMMDANNQSIDLTDKDLEMYLDKISDWIKRELV